MTWIYGNGTPENVHPLGIETQFTIAHLFTAFQEPAELLSARHSSAQSPPVSHSPLRKGQSLKVAYRPHVSCPLPLLCLVPHCSSLFPSPLCSSHPYLLANPLGCQGFSCLRTFASAVSFYWTVLSQVSTCFTLLLPPSLWTYLRGLPWPPFYITSTLSLRRFAMRRK